MLTEMCEFLRNWFDKGQVKYYGDFSVSDGALVFEDGTMEIQTNQYYRIIGSVFNDGIHKYGDETDTLTDEETFDGAVWLLALPADFLALASEIQTWVDTYGGASSQAMSPFSSESFAGYSYSKGSDGITAASKWDIPSGWEKVFYSRLRRWKKL